MLMLRRRWMIHHPNLMLAKNLNLMNPHPSDRPPN